MSPGSVFNLDAFLQHFSEFIFLCCHDVDDALGSKIKRLEFIGCADQTDVLAVAGDVDASFHLLPYGESVFANNPSASDRLTGEDGIFDLGL